MADLGGRYEKGDLPVYVKSSERSGPYASAHLNPNPAIFSDLARNAGKIVFEIGCGVSPRMSWKLGKKELWVGCDPGIPGGGDHVIVHKTSNIDSSSELVVFSEKAQDVPPINPDVLIMVAPNPRDIAEDQILPSLEKFIGGKQTFVIALDTRTHEAVTQKYLSEAKTKIDSWMRNHGFRETGLPGEFKPNSGDLGGSGSNLIKAWKRG